MSQVRRSVSHQKLMALMWSVTLEHLFAKAQADVLDLAREYVDLLYSLPTWTMNLRLWLQESHDTVGIQSDI